MTNDISTLEFVAFDTETTGLSPQSEALVEVAAVRFDLVHGAKEYFQTLINPGKSIPWQATRVHGITDEMVFESPSVEKVLPAFYQFVEGAIPVAHNAPFDLGFLSLYSLRTGLTPPEVPVLDSCMFSRRVMPHMASHKLEFLVQQLGIGETTFHRALADARSCMEVFRIAVQESCGIQASWDSLIARHGKVHSFATASSPVTKAKKPSLEPLFQALQEKRSIWIQYEGGYSAREVTPLLLYAKGQQQYMEATCHLDGMKKSFRLDRVKKVYPLGEKNS